MALSSSEGLWFKQERKLDWGGNLFIGIEDVLEHKSFELLDPIFLFSLLSLTDFENFPKCIFSDHMKNSALKSTIKMGTSEGNDSKQFPREVRLRNRSLRGEEIWRVSRCYNL